MDRLGRLYLVVASLYWVFKYLPGVVADYKAKNGDVSRSSNYVMWGGFWGRCCCVVCVRPSVFDGKG